jgi:predicted nucleic acid-binding protein
VNFLLDTNVISETMKPRPNPGLLGWLADADEDRTFLSVITLMELRYGIERMAGGRKRKRFEEWLDHDLPLRFESRILAIDARVADTSGRLVARSESLGRPIETRDALIAATAEIHGLTLVTRNVSDFESTVRELLSPWN